MAFNPITGKDDGTSATPAGTTPAAITNTSTTIGTATTGTTPAVTTSSTPATTTPTGIINTAIYSGGSTAGTTPAATTSTPTANATTTPAADNSSVNIANWYRSTLGRDPDAAGLAYWQNELDSGKNAATVYKAFTTSAKDNSDIYHAPSTYQDANVYKGPTSGNTNSTVDDWAQNVLGRSLTAGEVAKYDQLMSTNPTVAGAKAAYDQFLTDYAGSVKNKMDWMAASQINQQQQSSGVAPPSVTPYNAINAYINPDTDTVQGQINGLLKNGNPLLDRAAALSDQKTNERGLVFSTMGAQAGQTAVLDAALQIATPDAGFYSQQRLANQGYQNDAAKTNAAAQNTVNNMGYANQLTQSNMGLQQQYTQDNMAQANLNAIAQNNASLAGNLANSLAILKAQATTSQSQTAYQQALQTVSDLNSALTTIQTNPNLDAAAVAGQRNKAIETAKSRLSYLSSLSGTDYGDLIKYFSMAETT